VEEQTKKMASAVDLAALVRDAAAHPDGPLEVEIRRPCTPKEYYEFARACGGAEVYDTVCYFGDTRVLVALDGGAQAQRKTTLAHATLKDLGQNRRCVATVCCEAAAPQFDTRPAVTVASAAGGAVPWAAVRKVLSLRDGLGRDWLQAAWPLLKWETCGTWKPNTLFEVEGGDGCKILTCHPGYVLGEHVAFGHVTVAAAPCEPAPAPRCDTVRFRRRRSRMVGPQWRLDCTLVHAVDKGKYYTNRSAELEFVGEVADFAAPPADWLARLLA
jgi:hypothetical protein